jgi:hypothetical protein
MKFFHLIIIMLVIVLISGCVNNSTMDANLCTNSCEDQEFLERGIERSFGLVADEYTVECSECLIGRGGHVTAKITYNENPLELYHKWGWCTSGGTDCGWEMGFTSFSDRTDEIYSIVKNKFCSKISSSESNDGKICVGNAFDNTDEMRERCLAGDFEKSEFGKKTLSIDQNSNRCSSSATQGSFGLWDR